ncbi:Transposase [Nitrococcus mobilis Nb-231]|uniref:Transposase n=1 Tax=Nitrococcus mobilis Nb-231 TaxID=314278 RepID=A4BLH1_9GAMM|nr:Transposase [Nitrococcus mobilis Nb-231]
MISQCLNRRIDTIAQLREQVSAWQEHRDQLQAKVNWQFTTQDARIKLKRLYTTFNA